MTKKLILIRSRLSKKFLLIGVLLIISGCGSVPEINVSLDVTYKIFEIRKCKNEQSCYFQYPYGSALAYVEGGDGSVEYNGCKVNYGPSFSLDPDQYYDVTDEKKDGKIYQTMTRKDGTPIYYVGSFLDNKYKVWMVEKNVSLCKNFWKQIFDSFTDKPVFISDKYGFKAGILAGYKVDYDEKGQGFTMVHRVEGDELKTIYEKELESWPSGAKGLPYNQVYNIEIGITVYENVQGYSGISDLLQKEYPGYTMDFAPNGVFIGEDQRIFAVRNFVTLSPDNKYIYRAHIRIPSQMYDFHKAEFDEWTKTITFF